MKILFDVNHAGHVHFVKNAYKILNEKGHSCFIVASDKPLVYKLLDEYNLPYYPMGTIGKSLSAKLLKLLQHNLKLFFYCLKNRPDAILGIVAIRGAHVGWLLKIRSIVFTDTEHAKMQIALFKPFANEIHNPNWFTKNLGSKQIRYQGFHELAYLHPNNFIPRPQVKSILGLAEDEPFFLLRFVAWDATHDKNQFGISLEKKRELVATLSKHGRVFISSEYKLEEEFKAYEFNIPFSYLHDALYYSSILISEGATTACEAAILGVPTIYVNSLALGYITYMEEEYGLLYHLTDPTEISDRLAQFLENDHLKVDWLSKKDKFIQTQNDTTAYIIDVLENKVQS